MPFHTFQNAALAASAIPALSSLFRKDQGTDRTLETRAAQEFDQQSGLNTLASTAFQRLLQASRSGDPQKRVAARKTELDTLASASQRRRGVLAKALPILREQPRSRFEARVQQAGLDFDERVRFVSQKFGRRGISPRSGLPQEEFQDVGKRFATDILGIRGEEEQAQEDRDLRAVALEAGLFEEDELQASLRRLGSDAEIDDFLQKILPILERVRPPVSFGAQGAFERDTASRRASDAAGRSGAASTLGSLAQLALILNKGKDVAGGAGAAGGVSSIAKLLGIGGGPTVASTFGSQAGLARSPGSGIGQSGFVPAIGGGPTVASTFGSQAGLARSPGSGIGQSGFVPPADSELAGTVLAGGGGMSGFDSVLATTKEAKNLGATPEVLSFTQRLASTQVAGVPVANLMQPGMAAILAIALEPERGRKVGKGVAAAAATLIGQAILPGIGAFVAPLIVNAIMDFTQKDSGRPKRTAAEQGAENEAQALKLYMRKTGKTGVRLDSPEFQNILIFAARNGLSPVQALGQMFPGRGEAALASLRDRARFAQMREDQETDLGEI